jgi:hypothetical protein
VQALGLLYVFKFLKERRENFLKDLGGCVFIETRAAGNRVDETLIAIDERFPRSRVAAPAS